MVNKMFLIVVALVAAVIVPPAKAGHLDTFEQVILGGKDQSLSFDEEAGKSFSRLYERSLRGFLYRVDRLLVDLHAMKDTKGTCTHEKNWHCIQLIRFEAQVNLLLNLFPGSSNAQSQVAATSRLLYQVQGELWKLRIELGQ